MNLFIHTVFVLLISLKLTFLSVNALQSSAKHWKKVEQLAAIDQPNVFEVNKLRDYGHNDQM